MMAEDNPLLNIKVLAADQNPQLRNIVRSVLLTLGIRETKVVANGGKFIEMANSGVFDVAIVDFNLPEKGGLDAVSALRDSPDSQAPMLPVIMMAENWEYLQIVAARDAGVNEYLAKPFSPAQLQKRLEAVILHPRAFVKDDDFFGPDRRRMDNPAYNGGERRVDEPNLIQPDEQKSTKDEFGLFD